MNREPLAIRFRYSDGEERTYIREAEWPLPERFEAQGGYFRKVSESHLPAGVSKHVLRGAVYEWVEA